MAGVAPGVLRIKVSVEVPIPAQGKEPNWLGINNGKITVVPVGGGVPEVFNGCCFASMSSKYTVETAAVRSLHFIAQNNR